MGLSINARLSSVIFVIALFASYLLNREPDKNKALLSVILSVVLGALLYLPSFVYVGWDLTFLTYDMGEMDWFGRAARFVYKNIYFLGLQTFVALLFMTPFIIRGFKRNYKDYKNILIFSLLMIVGIEAMYLKFPLEKAYLLPMLPFVLILLGISLKNHRKAIIFLLVIQFSYNFISFNIARPDVPNFATSATLGFWLEWGHLVTDAINRLGMLN